MKPIYIQSVSQFICQPTINDKTLKMQLKQDFSITSRRSSRLTLFALLGAMQLRPIENCGVYVTSCFSSPSNMCELEMQIFQHKVPKPFDFINSINNAVPFYVAQALNVNGPNLFIASDNTNWSQIFLPGIADLHLGIVEQALIGWCYESSPPRVNIDNNQGSNWLLLSRQHENAIARLTITNDNYIVNSDTKYGCYHQDIIDLINNINEKLVNQLAVNIMPTNKKLLIDII